MNNILRNKITVGDSSIIWFDYNTINKEELDKEVISNFDILNMPIVKHNGKVYPDVFELDNYYVTFFKDYHSSTGYSCMYINKDKKIYKSKVGYEN